MLTDLRNLLPHRPPFLFIDDVIECVPGASCVATWTIRGDETWLAGHFPGNPIVPGVLLLESLAQAGAIAVLADPRHAGRLPLFGGVEKVRFRRQVKPGDMATLSLEVESLGSRGGWGNGTVSVDGSVAVTARLMFVIVDAPSPEADA